MTTATNWRDENPDLISFSQVTGVDTDIQENKNETFEALVTPLLVNSEGKKMGKTSKGALWVVKEKTSVYDFYQYFVNQKDEDVEKLLLYFSEISPEEIKQMISSDIITAKRRMAFEVTKLIHGEEEAIKAQEASETLFAGGKNYDNVPTVEITKDELANIGIINLLLKSKLATSSSDARRVIEQGGAILNDEKISDIHYALSEKDFEDGFAILKRGKKSTIKVNLK